LTFKIIRLILALEIKLGKEHIIMCQNAGDSGILVLERPPEYGSLHGLTAEQEAETLKKESLPELLQWMMDNNCNYNFFAYTNVATPKPFVCERKSINKRLGEFLFELCKGKRATTDNNLIVNYKGNNWVIWSNGRSMGNVSILIYRCNFVPI
jgi:hypothetical protein